MIGEADYRNVTSAVRTPRLAVFIHEDDPHWQTSVASLIRIFSSTWGGKYFLIVPTNGKRIKDKFWELLEAYSPDSLGTYEATFADLEEADPARYNALLEPLRKDWNHAIDFDKWLNEHQRPQPIGGLTIDPALVEQLKNRLAPFHHAEHVLDQRLIRDHPIGYPFTKIADINPNAHSPIKKLVLSKPVDDIDLRALILSQAGDLNAKELEELVGQGVQVATLPDDYGTGGMVQSVMRGSLEQSETELRSALASQFTPGTWGLYEDFVQHMPFQASMLHLARYYRLGVHRDWEEPVRLVVGDTAEDFCLYYCLSRLHDDIYWLPRRWLEDHDRRLANNQRLRRKGRPTRPYSEVARVAKGIVGVLYWQVGSGRRDKELQVQSVSLDAAALKGCVAMVDRAHWGAPGEIRDNARVVELAASSTDCIARVIETDNYVTQQDMVFIGGKSVGRIATPKPKNFNRVNPAVHRWFTSSTISEYTPPVLPFLGRQIVLTYESRVDSDGIVYSCPGFIIAAGADVDTNLVRPQLALIEPEEILRQYFAASGLDIQPSDKGNYLSDTIDRFGGLAPAAEFIASPKTRAILDLFLAKKSAADGHVVYLSAEGGRAFVNYDAVRTCVGDEAPSLIDELVGKDILRRGLIFLCVRCRMASWYDLAVLTSEFECRRCSKRQQFTKTNWKMPDEPRWYYALAETVFQCHTHNSHLTILALDHLRKRARTSFQYVPEIDVINFPSDGAKHEIDIACMIDNRIVLGECKTEAFAPDHAKKYETLANKLPKRPDEIVFVTSLDQVSDAFRAKVGSIRGASIITRSDLQA